MGKIHLLAQNTIDQIAAGEVIDRPVSVVKELTENAIDAGATAVTIEVKEGGTSLIRVTDNGGGIEKDDLQIAFVRHATSKIADANDLLTVRSLGFRGEALSSIGAIARVELITRTRGSLVGSRYVIEGGQEVSLEEIGAPEGTTIIIRDLFFNTPARKKFLKTPQTEGSHINDMVSKMALSRPDISFRLIINGQNKFHTSGNHNLKDVIYQIYGRDVAKELLPLDYKCSFFSLKGFIGKPLIARGSRATEIYFINGRYIKSGLISKAIEEGYRNFLMQHKFPLCVFDLIIDPEFTDVNVHPSKMEIRFRNQQYLYEELLQAIRKCLTMGELAPKLQLEEPSKTSGTGNGNPKTKTEPAKQMPEPFEQNRRQTFLKETEALYQAEGLREETSSTGKPVMGQRPWQSQKPVSANEDKQYMTQQTATPVDDQPAVVEEIQFGEEQETQLVKAQDPQFDQVQDPQFDQVQEVHQRNLFEEKLLTMDTVSEVKLAGQIFDTYWIAEYRDTFLLIDQHAAHEKVNYERILKELKSRSFNTQQLNPPKVITLTPAQMAVFAQTKKVLEEMGFELEPFGGNDYAVYGMPDNLVGITAEDLLQEMIDSLENSGRITPEAVYEKAASMACKGAIKGNQHISQKEAEQLIADLVTLENPYTCPHGRPTMIRMTKRELEKKFKRII